jgi:LuxR family transcriptional regulator, quorum-sensing system regulator BjaR1
MVSAEALDFIDKLDRCATVSAVLDAMKTALRSLDIDLFCLNLFPSPQQRFDEVLLASRLPTEWLELYLRERYIRHDPSQRHARRTVHPYEWKDAPYDAEAEPKALEVVQRATDLKVGNGFVVPVPGPSGCIGQVWMSRSDFRLTKRDKPALHVMALYAFGRVEQLARPSTSKPILTMREREILTWTATGKTAWEIGELLNISERTVEWHLQSIAQKLGTCNKVQTLTVAIREKLIVL